MKTFGLFLCLGASLGIAFASPETESAAAEGTQAEQERAMLGVATASVSPSLRDYLGLDPGFGIQIHDVLEGTPAADSGLETKDILVQLDNQRLISPEHLALLINTRAPGDKVELHLIRQGERTKMEVRLGALDPEAIPTVFRPDLQARASDPSHPWKDQMRKQQEIWEQWMKNRSGAEPPGSLGKANGDTPTGGRGEPSFPIHVFGKEGMVTIDNPNGSVTLETNGGETTITIRDGSDQLIHEGPLDAEKGVEGLPEKAREHLKKMKLDDLSQLSLPIPLKKRISAPMPPQMPPRIL
ncbi:MAG: PDZ domain-containing protein [Verrucomicrobiales bacterium]|nr:PDZ domain-containing protein [Verrucomicrobiales bacterium]